MPKDELSARGGRRRLSACPAISLPLALILLAGILLRAWILTSPLGEVEADESVVGLMALHILSGEFPAFYWGQPYLGSLEAYLVATTFSVVGASNLILKTVPGLAYLAFVVLVFLGARRDHGQGVALLSAFYLALPPSFLTLWSLKARGGYVELLALGQAIVFLAPWAARPDSHLARRLGLIGLLAGLLLWIHPLGMVYVLPTAVYLSLRLGHHLRGAGLLTGAAGLLIGFGPALAYNAQHGWDSLEALSTGGSSQEVFQENIATLLRIGLPVMVGLGQATSSPTLFLQDWPHRPGSWPWVPPLLVALLVVALLPSLPAISAPVRGSGGERQATAFFGLAVLALTPPLASLGPFGELVAEPRYALPLYSAVPLFAAALSRLGSWRRLLPLAAVAGGLAITLNAYSLLTANPRLNLPTTAAGSTESNRAELLRHLEQRGLTEIYTDYWLAYPLMFESRERVLASVSSGGYNRFPPYAYFVSVSERPGFVFVSGSNEQAEFNGRLEANGGRAVRERVSIYEVYSEVEPLDRLRP